MSAGPQRGRGEGEPPTRAEILRRAGPFLGIGANFVASIAVCTVGGWLLDRWLETRPWLTLTGALTGLASGFYNFILIVRAARDRGPDGEG
jgi:F0F1-type ATP synthase assembly protein I